MAMASKRQSESDESLIGILELSEMCEENWKKVTNPSVLWGQGIQLLECENKEVTTIIPSRYSYNQADPNAFPCTQYIIFKPSGLYLLRYIDNVIPKNTKLLALDRWSLEERMKEQSKTKPKDCMLKIPTYDYYSRDLPGVYHTPMINNFGISYYLSEGKCFPLGYYLIGQPVSKDRMV
jgi:hypothetical protein